MADPASDAAAAPLGVAPVLSTPETHIFEDPTPTTQPSPRTPDALLATTYEIERTVSELRAGGWKRVALQFPDHMLVDAPRVYGELASALAGEDVRVFILGDTSYGACCVDEVAAEHVSADVVVHYGRSCLSPPSRLPVVYVFTAQALDIDAAVKVLQDTYPDVEDKVVLMADIPYAHHIPTLCSRMADLGYTSIVSTSIIHDPGAPLPNRSVPLTPDELRSHALFHVADPLESLLLTLASRVASTTIYPVSLANPTPSATTASTTRALSRRYALCTSLATVPIFGILINTLSVSQYMSVVSRVQRMISAAGKKHYTFVVGKVNAAKVANFSEVGGWVVIGCWESSLLDSREFWRPIITPFELAIALQSDEERVWTGEWDADFGAVLRAGAAGDDESATATATATADDTQTQEETQEQDDDEEEDAPPEFDLRTGRYVSHSRPMRSIPSSTSTSTSNPTSTTQTTNSKSQSLTLRPKTDIATINGVVSPGAEYLRTQRTWAGLGSDFQAVDGEQTETETAAKMEQGRRGIARGYVVGDGDGDGKH